MKGITEKLMFVGFVNKILNLTKFDKIFIWLVNTEFQHMEVVK